MLRRRQIEARSGGELFLRAGYIAGPQQRLAPFHMEAAPVRRIFRRLREFRERKIGAVLADQRFAPHFQRIGEVQAFLIGEREFFDRAVKIALRQQHRAPIAIGEGNRGRIARRAREPPGRTCPFFSERVDISARGFAGDAIARRFVDFRMRICEIAHMRVRISEERKGLGA